MSDELINICAKLMRHGRVATDEVLDLLVEISDINDDLRRVRAPELTRKRIAEMRAILDRMEATL